jgi:S1-C subfamily serine protease
MSRHVSGRLAAVVARLTLTFTVLSAVAAAPAHAQEQPSAADSPSVSSVPADTAAGLNGVVANARPSIVRIVTDATLGSGVSTADGILTSAHVVQDTAQIDVYSSDHRHATATIARIDPTADVALLKTDLTLPGLDLEGVGSQQIGDPIVAVGYPGATPDPSAASVAQGQLASTGTGIQGRSLLEITNSLEPGYSGGPILNGRGHVIGLSTYVTSPEGGLKLNFAVGSDTLYAFLALPQDQVAPRPMKLFTKDPKAASLPQAYLGAGWVLESEDASHTAQGEYGARFHLDPQDGSGRVTVDVAVEVTSSPAAASIGLPVAAAGVDKRLEWLGSPQIGDESGAWLSESGTSAVVAARVANVIVFAFESRPQALSRDNLLGAGSVSDMVHYMCDRVVSQVQ